jgi:hypothetical protein
LEISETAQILQSQYLVALYSTFTRALTFEKLFFFFKAAKALVFALKCLPVLCEARVNVTDRARELFREVMHTRKSKVVSPSVFVCKSIYLSMYT